MPKFGKKSLSLFLRNGCERQFLLSLYTDVERAALQMPVRQKARAGLGFVAAAGYDWQDQKVSELKDVFGLSNVHVNPLTAGGKRPEPLPLLPILPNVVCDQFIVEADYEAGTATFRSTVGLMGLSDYYGDSIDISHTHPDIIQILPSLSAGTGPAIDTERDLYKLGVLPSGDTFVLDASDSRLRLRVIDVKLASDPGAHYFAEVVYYSMTLAAWLLEQHLDEQFAVVAAAAVWPGTHEASNLTKQSAEWKNKAYQPTAADLAAALELDIEIAPFDVFVPRLRRFFSEQFPSLLSKPWEALNWHVDFRCKGCEFLGYPWQDKDGNLLNDPSQCMPTAEHSNHLSRVFGLSRGASEELRSKHVEDTLALAGTGASSPAFDEHQGLRAKRTTFPHRALALHNSQTSIVPDSGGDALMPKWPDLHVYIFLDYELSSAITAAIALRAFWFEPLPFGSALKKQSQKWTVKQGEQEVFLVDQRRIERERAEFLKFLRQLRKIFGEVLRHDDDDMKAGRRDKKTLQSTYQIYLWDESQRKHLVRLIGRHLPYILADPHIRDIAWLFPPPELLQHAEDATRQSPITLVSNVVENTVAIPVPHHYRLLDVVQTLKPDQASAPSVHPLYEEPMSDLIPGERIHEWWQHTGHWQEKQGRIEESTQRKAYALNLVVTQLEKELAGLLSRQAAPPLARPRNFVTGIAPQSRLWLEYTRLNAALDSLEAHTIRAMPPREREARLKSARLQQRLSGQEELIALAALSQSLGRTLAAGPDLFVYAMNCDSREFNVKPGDPFYALAPEHIHGFLDEHPYRYIQGTSLEEQIHAPTIGEGELTSVSIEAIDRVHGYIALRADPRSCILQLEKETSLDFSHDVVLDPCSKDFLTKKIQETAIAIGNPPSAVVDERTLEALGLPANTPPGTSAPSPAAKVLWEAAQVHAQKTNRNLVPVRTKLEQYFSTAELGLDASQWAAWEEALSCRLSLIWGPPGTGKSHTLRAVVLGAVLDSIENKKPLRLLITANTYTAIDNVILKLDQELSGLLPTKPYGIYRIQSKWRPPSPEIATEHPDIRGLSLNQAKPSDEIKELQERLDSPSGILIVGCPPQQLHNLAVAGKKGKQAKHAVQSWFDVIILDEASQVDVASSTLVFTKLSPDGSCVLAGDDLQLPPIHSADPPKDLEHVVGSAYNYFRRHQSIEPSPLEVNYRSNSTIVEFVRLAGYSPGLQSYSPNLQLQVLSPIPAAQPVGWPGELCWSGEWAKFLDPAYSTVAFIYDDTISSQANDFEADTVAALTWLLNSHLADKLQYEKRADGSVDAVVSSAPYTSTHFWNQALGVVTPHRAQVAKIVYRLQQIFPTHSREDIRGAVDTVERFQGQQRNVIIGSFGLGDPDIISAEDGFLYNLNRFNVLTSRARAKLIVLVTRTLLEHLSNDADVLEESRLLKQFAETYCVGPQMIQLGFLKNQVVQQRSGVLRRR